MDQISKVSGSSAVKERTEMDEKDKEVEFITRSGLEQIGGAKGELCFVIVVLHVTFAEVWRARTSLFTRAQTTLPSPLVPSSFIALVN